MPIAPCFDPTTGASGGAQPGGGGGADLSALGFTAIDITDGFTLTDPDSLVDSSSSASGVNQVVFNALAVGSTDYAWGSGNNQRAPRWVKDLSAEDATGGEVQVQSGDTFILQTVVQFQTPDNRFASEVVVASSVDGTGLDCFTNDAMGGLIRYNATGNIPTRDAPPTIGWGPPVLLLAAIGAAGYYLNPGDPVEEAVQSLLVARNGGGSGYMLRIVPDAAMVLAQGSGRLIRSATDRGALVLLDNRVRKGGAGWAALRAAIPPFPMSYDVADVGNALAGEPLQGKPQAPRARQTRIQW